MPWLFAAFAIVWIAIFVYLFNLDRKQRMISEEIAALKSKLSGAKKD